MTVTVPYLVYTRKTLLLQRSRMISAIVEKMMQVYAPQMSQIFQNPRNDGTGTAGSQMAQECERPRADPQRLRKKLELSAKMQVGRGFGSPVSSLARAFRRQTGTSLRGEEGFTTSDAGLEHQKRRVRRFRRKGILKEKSM